MPLYLRGFPIAHRSKYAFEQYKAAFEALRGAANPEAGRWTWKSYVSIAFVSLSVAIALKTASTRYSTLLFIAGLAITVYLLSIGSKSNQRKCLKKVYATIEKQLNGQRMQIDEVGISGSTADGTSSYTFHWAAFERLIDLPDGFLFLPNAATFVRVPKDSLNADEQKDVLRWAVVGGLKHRPYEL